MNREELENLGRDAHLWAQTYRKIKESLLAEGIPEDEATVAARSMTNAAILKPKEEDPEPWKPF